MCFILMCIFCAPYTFKDLIKCFIISTTVPNISDIILLHRSNDSLIWFWDFNTYQNYLYLVILTWTSTQMFWFLGVVGCHCNVSFQRTKNMASNTRAGRHCAHRQLWPREKGKVMAGSWRLVKTQHRDIHTKKNDTQHIKKSPAMTVKVSTAWQYKAPVNIL
jgi:hypothetical protein